MLQPTRYDFNFRNLTQGEEKQTNINIKRSILM
jgi:hypothetical protein